MTYRHSVYIETVENEKLARLAAEAGAIACGLPYPPAVHFFVEDENGKYPRAVRCKGFIDFRTSNQRLDVFVRRELPARETVEIIFHEVEHIAQAARGEMKDPNTRAAREQSAERRSLLAPVSDTYPGCVADLARLLCRYHIDRRDYERAQAYHRELQKYDPETAAEIDCSTPQERRLRIRMEAERLRAQVEEEVMIQEKAAAFKEWLKEQDKKLAWFRE